MLCHCDEALSSDPLFTHLAGADVHEDRGGHNVGLRAAQWLEARYGLSIAELLGLPRHEAQALFRSALGALSHGA